MRRSRRVVILLALSAVGLIGCAVRQSQVAAAQATPLDELLLFFPSPESDGNWNPEGLEVEDVWLELPSGVRVHGWFCPHAEPLATLLFLHGNAGNLSQRAPALRRLHALGAAVLILDYPGYGRSAGKPSVESALEAGRVARAFLATRTGVVASEQVLLGRSLGGALAVQLAAEVPARALVIESSFSSLRAAAAVHFPHLAWLVAADKLDSSSRISLHQGALLQSHGDADQTIPLELGRQLFDAAPEPKRFLSWPGLDHNDPNPVVYDEALRQFLRELTP